MTASGASLPLSLSRPTGRGRRRMIRRSASQSDIRSEHLKHCFVLRPLIEFFCMTELFFCLTSLSDFGDFVCFRVSRVVCGGGPKPDLPQVACPADWPLSRQLLYSLSRHVPRIFKQARRKTALSHTHFAAVCRIVWVAIESLFFSRAMRSRVLASLMIADHFSVLTPDGDRRG